jgi:hypothetical protein
MFLFTLRTYEVRDKPLLLLYRTVEAFITSDHQQLKKCESDTPHSTRDFSTRCEV